MIVLSVKADCGGVPKSHLSLWDLCTTVSVKPSHRGTGNGLQECNDKKERDKHNEEKEQRSGVKLKGGCPRTIPLGQLGRKLYLVHKK